MIQDAEEAGLYEDKTEKPLEVYGEKKKRRFPMNPQM